MRKHSPTAGEQLQWSSGSGRLKVTGFTHPRTRPYSTPASFGRETACELPQFRSALARVLAFDRRSGGIL